MHSALSWCRHRSRQFCCGAIDSIMRSTDEASGAAVLEADDLAGSVLVDVDTNGEPVELDSFTQEELATWRAGPCPEVRSRHAVRALQVCSHTTWTHMALRSRRNCTR